MTARSKWILVALVIVSFGIGYAVYRYYQDDHLTNSFSQGHVSNGTPHAENGESLKNSTEWFGQIGQGDANQNTLPPWPHGKPGETNLPLAEMPMPENLRKQMLLELELFRKTGSNSGGVVTNEFSMADDLAAALKKLGLEKLKQSLAIIPTDLCLIAGSNYHLIGANNQAKYVSKPNEGWSGFLQLCKNEKQNVLIELSENQYELVLGDSSVGASEFINAKVLQSPASLQRVTDKDGLVIYSLDWFTYANGTVGARRFNLVAKNLPSSMLMQLAERISLAFLAMPHDGWKKTYIDPREAPSPTNSTD